MASFRFPPFTRMCIGSRKESNTTPFRFDSSDDAVNYARHVVEQSNEWLSSDNWRTFKAYPELKADVVCGVSVASRRAQYQLVLSAIPGWRQRKIPEPSYFKRISSHDVKRHRGQSFVFACVGHFIQGPQGIIPSLVRLERAKKREDFSGESRTCFTYSLGKRNLGPPKREVDLVKKLRVSLGSNGNCIGCVVKGRS